MELHGVLFVLTGLSWCRLNPLVTCQLCPPEVDLVVGDASVESLGSGATDPGLGRCLDEASSDGLGRGTFRTREHASLTDRQLGDGVNDVGERAGGILAATWGQFGQ